MITDAELGLEPMIFLDGLNAKLGLEPIIFSNDLRSHDLLSAGSDRSSSTTPQESNV
jgi:hypothetical protein